MHKTQLVSGHHLEESLHHQLSEKRQEILDLEHQMGLYRRDVATLRGQLAASEEVRSESVTFSDEDTASTKYDCSCSSL